MEKSLRLIAALFASCLCVAGAFAQSAPNRVWVSAAGTDAPGCYAVTNPCRSFQYAHDLIAPSGEIDVATPGGYGTLVITKSVTINNDGVGAVTIQAPTGNAITINANQGDGVSLKGLSIDGANSGANGIFFSSGGALTVTNCTIRHFALANGGNGILIQPTTGTVPFAVTHSVLSDNGSAGLYVLTLSGNPVIRGIIDGVTATGNQVGIRLSEISMSNVSSYVITNSILSNDNDGLYIDVPTINNMSVNIGSNNISNDYGYGIDNVNLTSNFTTYGGNILGNSSIYGPAPTAKSPL